MELSVYGASDDLIEIEGAIREEFPAYGDDAAFLAFSDGTVLRVAYGQGNQAMWHITRVATGTAAYSHHGATDEDKDYSDRVTLSGEIEWVVCGRYFEKTVPA